jgi:RNA polymerase sigma-70 factor (ECF subfamily)
MAGGMALGDGFETVLAAAQAGEEWAFERLYRELNPRLLRYFAARAPGVAEDLAAEAWLGAARQLGSFRGGERAFWAWMFTIAHRRLVQHWRDGQRSPRLAEPIDADLAGSVDARDPASVVVDSLTTRDAARQIASALSPDQAEVVLLRILGDLDVAEVARIVGKRPATVRVLLHRGLRKLAIINVLEGVTP